MRPILDKNKIQRAAEAIEGRSFTVLDFIVVFSEMYPKDWSALARRFGKFGKGRRYTVTTYLSNRLDIYSREHDSVLEPFVTYSEAKFRGYRRTTEDERRRFGSPWIAVFKKRNPSRSTANFRPHM